MHSSQSFSGRRRLNGSSRAHHHWRVVVLVVYAQIAMAFASFQHGEPKYQQIDFIVRSKTYYGLLRGKLKLGTLYKDEREKIFNAGTCVYCGATDALSLDHLIPRLRGGEDEANNLVTACRSCNSSKGSRDMLEWCRLSRRASDPRAATAISQIGDPPLRQARPYECTTRRSVHTATAFAVRPRTSASQPAKSTVPCSSLVPRCMRARLRTRRCSRLRGMIRFRKL